MITKLVNPKTNLYETVKSLMLSDQFPWYFYNAVVGDNIGVTEGHRNFSFLSNPLLARPNTCGHKYPTSQFVHLDTIEQMLDQIFDFNQINVECIYRINANLVYPQDGIQASPVHRDHDFPHKNLLIYLTDAGGITVYENEQHNPKEDDIIVFGGEEHYYYLPKEKRRVVLVVTYL